jgi:hypothetical protein
MSWPLSLKTQVSFIAKSASYRIYIPGRRSCNRFNFHLSSPASPACPFLLTLLLVQMHSPMVSRPCTLFLLWHSSPSLTTAISWGPCLVGTYIAAALYGLTVTQVYMYYKASYKDKLWLRALVRLHPYSFCCS